ncbi:MAG: DUF1361 domain-containing protein [Pirellulales bacterium]|nr:DUF1361 domain-containing protein [Pirellulales bacterium]
MNPLVEWVHAALRPHFHIGWNLFLALTPLAISLWIFRRTPRRGWLWWPVFFVFVLFLPNASYTLTDIIHFIEEVRAQPLLPDWSIVYFVIPKYAIFFFFGFQCHVISLLRMGRYLTWIGRRHWVFAAEIIMNALCSVGVYWGRYLRLNSWDIFGKPQELANQAIARLFHDELALSIIAVYFVVLSLFYYLMKVIDVAVWNYFQQRRLTGLLSAQAIDRAA